jgi:hypothetical protein
MTPEIARREVAAAREAGWYATTWNTMLTQKDKDSMTARRQLRECTKARRENDMALLRVVAASDGTMRAIRAAMPEMNKNTISTLLRRNIERADPWISARSIPDPARNRNTINVYSLTLLAKQELGIDG